MSDCGVCIGGYEADGCHDFSRVDWPKACKEHKCEECGRVIAKGEKYRRSAWKFDGEITDEINCAECVEIRDAFTCWEDGAAYCPGELWADMRSAVFPVLTSACFDKLKTPSAKEMLRQLWMRWKGLA